ncbi:bacillithiol biosynthesis cysteine-adding enzyme BshC [Fulvivirga maritima]|uniref:bacillithiol biosynthesis cysteine-adding enzyme BshC n=1 Tax=Fulvivirga maritima TaxID=2904247 RepID=UPI001F2AFCBA|nr:bacillithiol biosynthesis cysteine-adding enzyme BshC [Fulvivirga maritima]UII28612.1 bacillithiol biosynthesis cysteine-adding enzyme BshC [Fulvivirga maritima]
MNINKVDFTETHQFSALFLDYIKGKDQLKGFYNQYPEISNFQKQIEERNFSSDTREVLVKVLKEQYQHIDADYAPIKLLEEENTFTITTGHQLNIFTGPLYFIYKLVTVINTCKELKQNYPEYNFVPVYWMATEDHDFDEIRYFRLSGKKHQWSTEQKGGVGRFTTKGIEQIIASVPGMPQFFIDAYTKSKNLADAVRSYVHHLFGEEGLLVVDGDSPELKAPLKPYITADVINNETLPFVEKHTSDLEELGYKTQVHGREINFFYLEDGLRERIVKEDDHYKVLDTDLSFSEEEIKSLIDQHPERFSPNVVLRPLYQEVVLPNLAYAGGPAEVVYWLQLKSAFDHYGVSFPMLMPRNFALVIPGPVKRKMDKLELSFLDLFKGGAELEKEIVEKYSTHDIHLNGQKEAIMEYFDKIKAQATSIDPTLSQHVEAQQTKTKNRLEIIEKKFIRAEKKNQSDKLRQLHAVLDELFPGGSPQERVDNFLNFYLEDTEFIKKLITGFEPLDFRFNIITND